MPLAVVVVIELPVGGRGGGAVDAFAAAAVDDRDEVACCFHVGSITHRPSPV